MHSGFSNRLSRIETVLEEALPQNSTKKWTDMSFGSLPDAVTERHFENLITPCRNLMLLGGKRWRPLLLVLCAEMAVERKKKQKNLSSEQAAVLLDDAYSLTPLVEFVHTASLIQDDIEDGADMRRGKPAAYIVSGLDTALNASSWLYFEASAFIESRSLPDEKKCRLYKLFTQELRRLHLGQAMDIQWHRQPDLIPSIDEYTTMVRCKTGTLASFAAQAGILAGGGTEKEASHAGEIAAEVGIGFQILDDVQNLTTGNPGKKRGDDIVEGKKSLPVLYHLQKHPEDTQKIAGLLAAAKNDGINSPAVEKCVVLLNKSGAVEQAYNTGRVLIQDKSSALASLYETTGKDGISPVETLFADMLPPLKAE